MRRKNRKSAENKRFGEKLAVGGSRWSVRSVPSAPSVLGGGTKDGTDGTDETDKFFKTFSHELQKSARFVKNCLFAAHCSQHTASVPPRPLRFAFKRGLFHAKRSICIVTWRCFCPFGLFFFDSRLSTPDSRFLRRKPGFFCKSRKIVRKITKLVQREGDLMAAGEAIAVWGGLADGGVVFEE